MRERYVLYGIILGVVFIVYCDFFVFFFLFVVGYLYEEDLVSKL